jgi:hypothetical protein
MNEVNKILRNPRIKRIRAWDQRLEPKTWSDKMFGTSNSQIQAATLDVVNKYVEGKNKKSALKKRFKEVIA